MGCFHAKVIGSSAWAAHGVAVMLLIGGVIPWDASMPRSVAVMLLLGRVCVIPWDASMARSLGAQHGQVLELQ